jgi:predicted methyltransferase MtxX (methanogen marker protein 4)
VIPSGEREGSSLLRDKMKVKVAKSALFVQRLRRRQKMGPPAGDREVNLGISREVQRTRQTS